MNRYSNPEYAPGWRFLFCQARLIEFARIDGRKWVVRAFSRSLRTEADALTWGVL